jgi:tRNA pseudouridine55 synthase
MQNNRVTDIEGILLVDKPQEWTSHDVVAKIRSYFKIKKVGHAGTLDPMATGMLILLIGKATKVSQYLMSQDKIYTGTALLGQVTDSQDADGQVIEEKPVPEDLTSAQVQKILSGFIGDQYQLPPMFSAKKVNGQPLYIQARKGNVVEREPRVINVASFQITDFRQTEFDFKVHCSKGTYVRTLAHDVGQKIGCGAHLTALRRTAIGTMQIGDAKSLHEILSLDIQQLRKILMPVYKAVPSHVL